MTREELLKVAKPILFNTEMVKAILEGRKTVTRRCVKYKYGNTEMKMHTDKYGTRLIEIQRDVEGETHGRNPDGSTWHKLLPYIEKKAPYRKGDILYVRETWHQYEKRVGKGESCHMATFYGYRASIANSEDAHEPWKPSIHMPKEAARIFLKVKDVRVERLQEIDDRGCAAEGVVVSSLETYFYELYKPRFMAIWNSTIKKEDMDTYGWDANPYVWVIEFEKLDVK